MTQYFHLKKSLIGAFTIIILSLSISISPAFGATPQPSTYAGGYSEETPPSTQIVGGTTVPAGKYPYHVAVLDSGQQDPYWAYICGGTLIHPQWVVTAAHCVQDENNGQITSPGSLQILVGAVRLDSSQGTRINVSQVVPHPEFLVAPDKDIALIKLSQPAVLGTNVQTISIVDSPTSSLINPGIDAIVTGWGSIWEWPLLYIWEDVLREVTVPIVSNAVCQQAYNDMGVNITDNILCAGEDGLDACYFDSGGPLVVYNAAHNGLLLAGVVSFGHDDGCGAQGRYGGYTRVPAFTDWINNTTGQGSSIHKIFLSLIIR